MTRIAVLDDYQQAAIRFGPWDRLPDETELDVFHDHLEDHDDLASRLAEHDVVVVMRERTPFPASLLERLPNLRLLVTTGPFNDAIDVGAARRQGVVVSGTGGLLYPTTELTWALILALTKRVPQEDAAIRRGGWQTTVGVGLQGKTLGIIGLGNLGSAVARIAEGFDMDIVAWSQNLTDARAQDVGVRAVTKETLLTTADVVTIHLKLSARTTGIIGAAELGLMKPSACLVNTSRGPIVDEDALVEALRNGTIAGAALDVFDVEPLPADHPLRTLGGTVLTPHIGYVTAEQYELFFEEIVEDIEAFIAGEPIRVVTD